MDFDFGSLDEKKVEIPKIQDEKPEVEKPKKSTKPKENWKKKYQILDEKYKILKNKPIIDKKTNKEIDIIKHKIDTLALNMTKEIQLISEEVNKPQITTKDVEIHILSEENLLNFIRAKGKIRPVQANWFFLPTDGKIVTKAIHTLYKEGKLIKDKYGSYMVK